MDFQLTEEQKAIRKTVKEFSEKELEPYVKEWEKSGEILRDAFKKMAELGLTGINVPEKYGGYGIRLPDGCNCL
jgi:glutaryl-CoA dehydrogenase (non-decarboxylating)